jgi:hypothetical protein
MQSDTHFEFILKMEVHPLPSPEHLFMLSPRSLAMAFHAS